MHPLNTLTKIIYSNINKTVYAKKKKKVIWILRTGVFLFPRVLHQKPREHHSRASFMKHDNDFLCSSGVKPFCELNKMRVKGS